jgi:hypothetical protein
VTLAYSLFSLSEWTLVLLEPGFDALSIFEFGQFQIQVVKKSKIEDDEEEESGTKTPPSCY